MEPCKYGSALKEYKWCRCRQSCGPIEDKFRAYDMDNINGLHLIAEIYDDDLEHHKCRLYKRFRNRWLTEDYFANRRHWILFPQFPYGDAINQPPFNRWEDSNKANYNNYLEGTDPDYWGLTWPGGN